jgi:hypothetical protein
VVLRNAGADSCTHPSFVRAFRIAIADTANVAVNQVVADRCSAVTARQLHKTAVANNHVHTTTDIKMDFSVAARAETSDNIRTTISAMKPSELQKNLCKAVLQKNEGRRLLDVHVGEAGSSGSNTNNSNGSDVSSSRSTNDSSRNSNVSSNVSGGSNGSSGSTSTNNSNISTNISTNITSRTTATSAGAEDTAEKNAVEAVLPTFAPTLAPVVPTLPDFNEDDFDIASEVPVVDITDVTLLPTPAPTAAPTHAGYVSVAVVKEVKTIKATVGFPLTQAEATNPVMRLAIETGVAASLGLDADLVTIISAGGVVVRRRLVADLAIEFEIQSPAGENAEQANVLSENLKTAATTGALVTHVQAQAAKAGVLVAALQSKEPMIEAPVVAVASKSVNVYEQQRPEDDADGGVGASAETDRQGMTQSECQAMTVDSISAVPILSAFTPTSAPIGKKKGLGAAMTGLVAFFAVVGFVGVVLFVLVAVGYREARRNQVQPQPTEAGTKPVAGKEAS